MLYPLRLHPISRKLPLKPPMKISFRWTSTNPSTLLRRCPSCQSPISLPSSPCPKCSTLIPLPNGLSLHSLLFLSQPILSTSYRSSQTSDEKPQEIVIEEPDLKQENIFDLPSELSSLPARGFILDVRDIRNRALERQKQLHPDKHPSVTGSLSIDLSGKVNKAYEILSDPLKRVEYILSVHHPDLATAETDQLTDPGLLSEIMEARESLHEATTAEQVEKIREENHLKVTTTIRSIEETLSSDPPDLGAAKILAVQLKYWQGLENAAKEWESPRF
ncbi:Fe-S protein assembly co-chaperone HscB [Tremella mesenterica]|uniref:Fe-S protein assembly co-chaperone HscB n=1 Tax=Tremella mesenterica TaxID=5217 RepID=A0A4Q1BG50_TREME|nr:Fe-S protein assembly co-chaperone HscB [Tremella mesenterica]